MHGIVRDYLHNRKMTIVVSFEKKSTFLTTGCPQGFVVGPDFWNICLDELLEKLKERN